MPDTVLYTAEATSTGDGRNGHVASSDHKIDLDLAFPPEMGGTGAGSNPEQLFAAGYAACFHSALRLVAGRDQASLGDSTVTAQVGIGPDGDAFGLSVTLVIHVPGHGAGEGARVRRGGPPGLPLLPGDQRQHQRRAARSLNSHSGHIERTVAPPHPRHYPPGRGNDHP